MFANHLYVLIIFNFENLFEKIKKETFFSIFVEYTIIR